MGRAKQRHGPKSPPPKKKIQLGSTAGTNLPFISSPLEKGFRFSFYVKVSQPEGAVPARQQHLPDEPAWPAHPPPQSLLSHTPRVSYPPGTHI